MSAARISSCWSNRQRWAAGGRQLPAALFLALLLTVASAAPSGATADSGAPVIEGAAAAEQVTAAEGPLAATIAASTAAKANASTNATAAASGGAPKFGLIIVFREAATLARLRVMCNARPLVYRLFSRGLRLPADCYMPGVCRRIYSNTIFGEAAGLAAFAGSHGVQRGLQCRHCPWPA
jgi:hypothetical protein